MGEPFDAIGFKVTDEASYQALAEEAHERGTLSHARCSQGVLHGCCWRLGAGLEVWTVLYESKEGLFYADCRPAFRSQRVFSIFPWEIIEYEEDGEALARGMTIDTETELVFELQNLTEINPLDFGERALTAAISGLAYRAQVNLRHGTPVFAPLSSVYPKRKTTENDYAVRGVIASWREIKNRHTTRDLIWTTVDVGRFRLEVLVNRADLKGELKTGGWLSAEVWLQGHILNDKELEARYEGVDLEIPTGRYWRKLRRNN